MIFWRNGLEALKLRHFDLFSRKLNSSMKLVSGWTFVARFCEVCRLVYLKRELYVWRMKAMGSNIPKSETPQKEAEIVPLFNAQCIRWCCEVDRDAWRPIFRPSVGTRMSASVNQCMHAQLRTFRDENVSRMVKRITIVYTGWSSTADLNVQKVSTIPLDGIEEQRLRYNSNLDRL
jgi:hypothetical protein